MVINIQSKYYKNLLRQWMLWTALVAGMLFSSCSDADKTFEELSKQPEIIADTFKELYFVGDTLTVKGRLNPDNNLSIHIGDVQAKIVATDREELKNNRYGLVLDVVKVIITADMGIGENRPVTITSAGITIPAPSIEIVGDADAVLLLRPLQLVKVGDISSELTLVYARTHTGKTYYWNAVAKKLFSLTAAGGTLTEVFSEARCVDENGAFTFVNSFNQICYAVSPDEKYFTGYLLRASVNLFYNFI